MIVLLDLSGVFFNDGLSIAIERVCDRWGFEPAFVKEVLDGGFSKDCREGRESAESYWERAQREFGIDEIDELKQVYFDSYELQPGAKEAVIRLKKQYRLGFLSNSPPDRVPYLDEKFHFLELFDFGMWSYEAGCRKPGQSIYEQLLKKFELDATEIVFFDDGRKNLPPAEALGMTAIYVDEISQVEPALEKLSQT